MNKFVQVLFMIRSFMNDFYSFRFYRSWWIERTKKPVFVVHVHRSFMFGRTNVRSSALWKYRSRVVFNSFVVFNRVPAPHITTHSTLTLPSDPIWLSTQCLSRRQYSDRGRLHRRLPLQKRKNTERWICEDKFSKISPLFAVVVEALPWVWLVQGWFFKLFWSLWMPHQKRFQSLSSAMM